MTANNTTDNILIHNINNTELIILFPILPQLTAWKSVSVTNTIIRPSSESEDI